MNKKKLISRLYLLTIFCISIATFQHSAYGFGTINGMPEGLKGFDLYSWWLIGGLSATSIDFGIIIIIYSMSIGFQSKWLIYSLFVLTLFSGYSQLVYSANHAIDINAVTNTFLKPFMQFLLNIRIIVLPLCLPLFSLFYSFSAKSGIDENDYTNMESELEIYKNSEKENKEFILKLQTQLKEKSEKQNIETNIPFTKEILLTTTNESLEIEKFEVKKVNLFYFKEGKKVKTFHAINPKDITKPLCEFPIFQDQQIRYTFENDILISEINCKKCLKILNNG